MEKSFTKAGRDSGTPHFSERMSDVDFSKWPSASQKTAVQPLPDHCSKGTTPLVVATEDMNIPDGGLRAWSIVVGTYLALFATFGIVNAFVSRSTFVSSYRNDLPL